MRPVPPILLSVPKIRFCVMTGRDEDETLTIIVGSLPVLAVPAHATPLPISVPMTVGSSETPMTVVDSPPVRKSLLLVPLHTLIVAMASFATPIPSTIVTMHPVPVRP